MVEFPLFGIVNFATRAREEHEFGQALSVRVHTTPIRELEAENAEWHFRRPVFISLPIVEVGIVVRPFWRDHRPTPPLGPRNVPTYVHYYSSDV